VIKCLKNWGKGVGVPLSSLWHVIGLLVAKSELLGNGVGEVVIIRGNIAIMAKSSSKLLANLAVDCISGMELLMVKAVALDWSGVQSIGFMVVSVFVVVGIVICIIIIGSSIRKSSLASSVTSAVDCISGSCSWKVKAMAGGLPIIISWSFWCSQLSSLLSASSSLVAALEICLQNHP